MLDNMIPKALIIDMLSGGIFFGTYCTVPLLGPAVNVVSTLWWLNKCTADF